MTDKNADREENIDRNWFKKHAETLTVIASLFGGFIWMDSKFSSLESKFDTRIEKIDVRLSAVERDVAVIKTVLSIRGMGCTEIATRETHTEEKNQEKLKSK